MYKFMIHVTITLFQECKRIVDKYDNSLCVINVTHMIFIVYNVVFLRNHGSNLILIWSYSS